MATFTTVTKTKHSWGAPEVIADDYFFLIDDTYMLLIDTEDKFKIQGGRSQTDWGTVARNRFTY